MSTSCLTPSKLRTIDSNYFMYVLCKKATEPTFIEWWSEWFDFKHSELSLIFIFLHFPLPVCLSLSALSVLLAPTNSPSLHQLIHQAVIHPISIHMRPFNRDWVQLCPAFLMPLHVANKQQSNIHFTWEQDLSGFVKKGSKLRCCLI